MHEHTHTHAARDASRPPEMLCYWIGAARSEVNSHSHLHTLAECHWKKQQHWFVPGA